MNDVNVYTHNIMKQSFMGSCVHIHKSIFRKPLLVQKNESFHYNHYVSHTFYNVFVNFAVTVMDKSGTLAHKHTKYTHIHKQLHFVIYTTPPSLIKFTWTFRTLENKWIYTI